MYTSLIYILFPYGEGKREREEERRREREKKRCLFFWFDIHSPFSRYPKQYASHVKMNQAKITDVSEALITIPYNEYLKMKEATNAPINKSTGKKKTINNST